MLAMTVRESLAYPLLLRNISQGETEERIGYWRARLKIPQPWMGMTESELSLGQQQLVTLVRALVTLPKILLLDQPLSALDPVETSWLLERITEGISDLCPDVKTAVLMVTYQIDTFQEFSNRLLHLEQGQIVTNLSSSQVEWDALKTSLIRPAEEEW
jgi:D-methionine transport system ATP-binding protein